MAPPQGAFSVGSQDSPPSDPQEAEGGVNAGVNPTSTPPTAPRKGSPPAVQLFSVPTGFVAPCCSVVMSTSQRPAAHGAHPSRTTGRDAPGALTGIPGSATALAAASPDVFGKTVMSRENGTTAQGPKTHAAASSESMGQWRGARQAVQPPHTLWPGNQAISDLVKNRLILTRWKSHLDFFFFPSYTLRHRFARGYATAGSAAQFFSPIPHFGWATDNSS